MNSSNFLKVLEYVLLQHADKCLPVHQNQLAYRPPTGCFDAISVSKETVLYYNSKRSDVYFAMVDLSNVYDRIYTSLLCDKIR